MESIESVLFLLQRTFIDECRNRTASRCSMAKRKFGIAAGVKSSKKCFVNADGNLMLEKAN
jgi:hypothetical protein